MLEVRNFLNKNLYLKFKNFSQEIDNLDLTECIKCVWYYTSNEEFGVETRFVLKGSGKFDERYNYEIEEELQDKIYLYLKGTVDQYKSKLNYYGKQIVSPDFNIKKFRIEFQYTDTRQEFYRHAHVKRDLNAIIYIYPKKSLGTIFFEPERAIDWEENKCLFFTKEEHSFKNEDKFNKRFTVNFFTKNRIDE
jgi:hypothetical protein